MLFYKEFHKSSNDLLAGGGVSVVVVLVGTAPAQDIDAFRFFSIIHNCFLNSASLISNDIAFAASPIAILSSLDNAPNVAHCDFSAIKLFIARLFFINWKFL